MKKLLSLAALAAILGSTSLPAGAAATTKTGTVTVKWNVSVAANLTLTTDYGATGTQGGAGVPSILTSANGGSGTCTAPGAAPSAGPPPVVDFGIIAPDAALTANTDCLYKNAVDAQVTTNSTNWTLGASISSAAVAGSTVCLYPNNFASFPATIAAAGTAPATQSTRATYADNTTCAAAAATLSTTASSVNLISSAAQPFTASPAHVGSDLALLLSPTSPTGAQTVTLTYSLVAN